MKHVLKTILIMIGLTLVSTCFAFDENGNATSLGDVSQVATGLIFMTTNLMSLCFFLLGMGFTVGAIVRYRAHYKNPMAAPLMTPILMSFLAVIMFSFNAFNHWKQNEVFGGKKPPKVNIHVPNFNGKVQAANTEAKTPLQVLREMEHANKGSAPAQVRPQPQPVQPHQALTDDTYQDEPQITAPSTNPDYDFDDDDDEEEYAT